MARGVLAVFFVSGFLHAAPLILYTPNRRYGVLLVVGGMLFFIVHGFVIVLEGGLPRRVRRSWFGRVILYGTWAATLPLYPPLIMMALGVHGDRPLESYVLIRTLLLTS